MVREFPGFAGVGFYLILYGTVAVGFILGLLVLVPVMIRISPAENRDRLTDKSVSSLFGAALFGPAYLILILALSSFDSFKGSSFLQYIGVAVFLPVPIVSVALAIVGLVLALRGRFIVLKVGAGLLAAYFLLEFLLIAGAIIPSIGRIVGYS